MYLCTIFLYGGKTSCNAVFLSRDLVLCMGESKQERWTCDGAATGATAWVHV